MIDLAVGNSPIFPSLAASVKAPDVARRRIGAAFVHELSLARFAYAKSAQKLL
jgi:hypothetical protein